MGQQIVWHLLVVFEKGERNVGAQKPNAFSGKKKRVETNDSNTAQRETESCFIHLKQPVEGQFTHSTIYRLLYRSKGGIKWTFFLFLAITVPASSPFLN